MKRSRPSAGDDCGNSSPPSWPFPFTKSSSRSGSLIRRYPDIHIEIDGDQRLTDIVAAGYDAGVRMGGLVAKDMIAVPIGPDVPVAVVAAPSYLATRSPPATPHDLTSHRCINLRLPTRGGLYVWEFERDGRELRVRVEGQVTFSAMPPIVAACRDGFGLAYVPRHLVAEDLDVGDLVQLLPDWTPPFPGFQLYYPSRRHSAAFAQVVNALRYRR